MTILLPFPSDLASLIKLRSTSPTFDPTTWNPLNGSSNTDQNSLLTRLMSQMASIAPPPPPTSGTGNALPGYPVPHTRLPPGLAARSNAGREQDLGNTDWYAQSQGQIQPTYVPQSASPPFNLDVDAALLNDLFASYGGYTANASNGNAPIRNPQMRSSDVPVTGPSGANSNGRQAMPIPMGYPSTNSQQWQGGTRPGEAARQSYFGSF